MHPDDPSLYPADSCAAECEALASRRAFLRQAGSLVAGAAVFGGLPRLARALPIVGGNAVYPIPPQDATKIDRDNAVALVRFQNRIYGFVLWCPHQHTALRWQDETHRFQCPKHKSTFEPDGSFVSGRATRPMDRYAVRREGDTVVVDLAKVFQHDKDPEGWGQALLQL